MIRFHVVRFNPPVVHALTLLAAALRQRGRGANARSERRQDGHAVAAEAGGRRLPLAQVAGAEPERVPAPLLMPLDDHCRADMNGVQGPEEIVSSRPNSLAA